MAGCKMQAGTAYMGRHNQVAGIVYKNIWTEYGLEVLRSGWTTPPKVVKNDLAKMLWDLQIQTDKLVIASQPDIVFIDKQQKMAVVIDVAIPSDSNITKKEQEKHEKYRGLKEKLEKMSGVKVTSASGDWSTGGCDSQTSRVAQADPRYNIWGLCREETECNHKYS